MRHLLLGLLGGMALTLAAPSAYAVTINTVSVTATPDFGLGSAGSAILPVGVAWDGTPDLTAAVNAANAITVPLGNGINTGSGFTLSVNGSSGAAATATAGTPGTSESPFTNNASFFLVGPSFQAGGSSSDPALLLLSSTSNVFKFLWGSIDTWNVLYFLNNGVVTDIVTGAAAGGQTSGATGASLVSITGLQNYNEVLFGSYANVPQNGYSGNAFEFADISVVPLPAALWFGAAGLGLLGLLAWSKRLRRETATA